ncbi:exodeoxyribonuclease III [Lichenihabitans sp. Uapishka_5]|uniref:exodeoxyribonuclease III n=1 Tax=Lichenihabitans sp. Uapishka_5 TaxID=3037302 RepID=UPI0029E7E5D3|nr:exodeoxyribonuclease III [Lichenihabitans sp. Uapishka_5]MDX7950435.1 exodeoxyribonuclease III [Lichenihabitans sp. Uapishka_5]
MPLTLATWNINSIRLRLPLVRRFAEAYRPDVLCLQETKCPDGQFPLSDLKALGYEHIEFVGQKGYHGVATLSRLPLQNVIRGAFCRHGHARQMSVTLGGTGEAAGLTIHNFYVPAGGDVPDPALNDKFAHKLDFLDGMTRAPSEGALANTRAVLVGDLNIAPLETDVWSHKALLSVVSHTPVEVERFAACQAAGGWVDAMRRRIPPEQKLYTWWSYRSPDWAAADKGRRLDHIWVSQDLGGAVAGIEVVKETRGWERASDHVPVIATLSL